VTDGTPPMNRPCPRPRPRSLLALGLTLALAALALAEPPRDPNVGKSYRVPYKVTDTNHFLVRVRINGKGPFNFLVDTGAPALYVGTEAAKAAGLVAAKDDFWTGVESFDFEGGARLKGVKARIEDPFQLVGMNALGLPGASIDGILGFTILARFKIELDPTRDRMVWTRLDYEPKEPFIPRGAVAKNAPAEVEAMNLLGPLAKGVAALMGKQEPDRMIPRGRLGVTLDEADGVIKVAEVVEDSPAAKAGLKAGDAIVEVGEAAPSLRAIAARKLSGRSIKEALASVRSVRPGDKLAIKVRRGGETLDLVAVAGEGF